MKTCKACKEEKDLSEFYKDKDGLRPRCKKCFLKANIESRKKHWDNHLIYMRKYREKNPEKFKAREAKRFQDRKENVLMTFAKLREENKPYTSYKRRLIKLAEERILEWHETKKQMKRAGELDRRYNWGLPKGKF